MASSIDLIAATWCPPKSLAALSREFILYGLQLLNRVLIAFQYQGSSEGCGSQKSTQILKHC